MLHCYLKIAYRSILKNKIYTAINIFGLALGMASSFLMFSYVRFESSFDTFHPNADRTYRVDRVLEDGVSGSSAPPLANALKSNFPEIEEAMRVNTPGDFIIRFSDTPDKVLAFNENHVYAADSNFFSFFGFQLKEGNPRTALQGVNKVVISQEVANKLFGDKPALGRILELGDKRTAIEVTGVTGDQPENSHFHFDYLLSMDTNPNVKQRDWSWVWTQVVTYVRLTPDANPLALEEKMAQLGERVIKPAFEARGMNYQNTVSGAGWVFQLRPMKDIHLLSGDNRLGPVGDITYVYTFSTIGFFILLIAIINFINLSTARGAKRAKEVGVKKTMGALRSSLVTQFQIETVLLAMIAFLFAIVMMEGLRVGIVETVGINIPRVNLSPIETVCVFPLMPMLIGFLAGLYPSFYLTAFHPGQVLKGKLTAGMGNLTLRNSLVMVQFTISIALIAGTIIVFQQLKFIGSTNLGFDRQNVLLIKHAERLGAHLEAFRQEVENYPGVSKAGITMEVPGGGVWSDDFTRENANVTANIAIVKSDEQYLKTLDFELVTGRTFDEDRRSDKNAIIPNETTVHLFGWTPEEAIGQYLIYPGNNNTRHEIIGVMKDFHYQSLHQPITPVMFCGVNSDIWGDWRILTVKFNRGNSKDLVSQINESWNESINDTPMEYSFLEEDLAKQYESEQHLGGLFGIFSGLSILIAIIGLTGLVSYSVEVRKKEISIRKVFGASTTRIMYIMNRQYVRLIFYALLVSTPLSWWAITQWLDTFRFKIEVSPLTFAIAGAVELILAVTSVGYLSLLAASANPAKILREE
ncbi:MAG TPA: ABC transporter permease [Cyclobacteriaceae bacterium]|nr:ABC transporter permease [Cyclobacteriaceae bacterium]